MRRSSLILAAVTLTFMFAASARAETCTCPDLEAQISALATTVAQQNQAILAVTFKAATTAQALRTLRADYLKLEDAAWPVERRGRAQVEKILTSVETEHGIAPVPTP